MDKSLNSKKIWSNSYVIDLCRDLKNGTIQFYLVKAIKSLRRYLLVYCIKDSGKHQSAIQPVKHMDGGTIGRVSDLRFTGREFES